MLYFDEAGQRDLRVAKGYALVTSSRGDANISESLSHELQEHPCVRRKRSPLPKIGPLSIGALFLRLASFVPMQCGRQSFGVY